MERIEESVTLLFRLVRVCKLRVVYIMGKDKMQWVGKWDPIIVFTKYGLLKLVTLYTC